MTGEIHSFDDFLALFPNRPRKKIAGGFNLVCPTHNDKDPSLSATLEDDTILVKCRAGCPTEGVLKAKGLTFADLFLNSQKPKPEQWEIVAVYHYTDAHGKPFEVVRTNPKGFYQRQPDGKGGYINNLKGITPALYHQDEIKAAIAKGEEIYQVEGERDADRLRSQGLVATTNPMGAGKWQDSYSQALKGSDLVIIPDNDKPGRDHAVQVARSCYGIAHRIRILELPDDSKDVSDWLDNGHTVEELKQLEQLAREAPEWKPAPEEELDGLLSDVERFISLYVSTGEVERTALVLWVAHTHVIEAAECTPYMHITSPEKQSGKTRLLEVLALLVARPWFTARVSAAVLVRKVSRDAPTLLLDETDSAFKADKEYSETLRGILNAGYRRGAVVSLCVKKGGGFDLVDFPVFCPRALSGIGQLPDTIADRSIRISMKRRLPDDLVERFRPRATQAQASPLRERLEQWGNVAVTRLADARPVLPEELSDRAAEVWEPLFAVADMAGGKWPRQSRQAAGVLSSHADDGLSWGSQLLRDIALVLDGREGPVPSSELVVALVEREESPWGDLRGRPLDARKLAQMLRPYGIRPQTVRLGNVTCKGYQVEDFSDAFTRYIPGIAVTTVTPVTQDTPKANSGAELVTDVTDVTGKKGIRADADTPPYTTVLGMPVEKVIELWRSEGAPVVHTGAGENCFDLEKLLSNPCNERQLKAIRAWLDKVLKRRGE